MDGASVKLTQMRVEGQRHQNYQFLSTSQKGVLN